MQRAEIYIYGLVQGVFFRQAAKERADALGVFGWVRNEPNDSVKITAEGKENALKALIEWAHVGPKLAKVEKVEVEWRKATREFKSFEIL